MMRSLFTSCKINDVIETLVSLTYLLKHRTFTDNFHAAPSMEDVFLLLEGKQKQLIETLGAHASKLILQASLIPMHSGRRNNSIHDANTISGKPHFSLPMHNEIKRVRIQSKGKLKTHPK